MIKEVKRGPMSSWKINSQKNNIAHKLITILQLYFTTFYSVIGMFFIKQKTQKTYPPIFTLHHWRFRSDATALAKTQLEWGIN